MWKAAVAAAVVLLIVGPRALACTGVAIAEGGRVVVGGNEDWTRFDSHVWAQAATGDTYGAVYFGYQVRGEFGPRAPYWFEFQGVNDHGLYFDTFGAPTVTNRQWAGKPSCPEHIEILMMGGCATVEEAIELLNSYNLARYRHYNETIFRSNMQFFLADRTGAAAIVDGEHVHWMEDGRLVITNFRRSDPSLGGWPCWRYDLANDMLAADASPTVERVAEILDAVQFPCSHGYSSCTRYSVVCDLVRSEGYLYFNGDFARSIRLDLAELCRAGLERTSIESLLEDALAQDTVSVSTTDEASTQAAALAFALQQTIQGSWAVCDTELLDFDGDGDLDLLCACRSGESFLLWNDGDGGFSQPDYADAFGSFPLATAGDFDGNGAPDALVGDFDGNYEIWLNDGTGSFAIRTLPQDSPGASLASGDLDGDGDLDAFVGTAGAANFLWINDGSGQLTSVAVPGSADTVNGIHLSDLDGDGDLDAALGRFSVPNVLCMNDGLGSFVVRAGALGETHSGIAMASGDFDSDGDVDLFVGAHDGADSVWLNDGNAVFHDSGQQLSPGWSYEALAVDIDGDSDLDLVVAGGNYPDGVWVNDGAGRFTRSPARFVGDQGASASVGDLDGDSDSDIVFAHDPGMSSESKIYVWLNAGE